MTALQSRGSSYVELFKNNNAPSEAQRLEVIDKLRQLEDEYEALTKAPNSTSLMHSQDDSQQQVEEPDELPYFNGSLAVIHADQQPLTRRARKFLSAIRRHRAILSPVRSVPVEIWQKVFVIALWNLNNKDLSNRYSKTLHSLCSVCRLWDDAAAHLRGLWTDLPTVVDSGADFSQPGVQCFARYLKRSNPSPISFIYYSHRYSVGHMASAIQAKGPLETGLILPNTLQASQRWNRAVLHLDLQDLQHISSIQSRIPYLEELNLVLSSSGADQDVPSQVNKIFSDAPSLRRVSIHTRRIAPGAFTPVFDLPWSQIETFRNSAARDLYYTTLVNRSKDTLTTLELDVDQVSVPDHGNLGLVVTIMNLSQPLSQHHYAFPRLRKLEIRVPIGQQYETLLGHLAELNLPALEELGLSLGRGLVVIETYQDVMALLRYHMSQTARGMTVLRSVGNHLKRLVLHESAPLYERNTISMLQNLEHLEIATPTMEYLDFCIGTLVGPTNREFYSMPYVPLPGGSDGLASIRPVTLPRLKALTLRKLCTPNKCGGALSSTYSRPTPEEREWGSRIGQLIALRTYAVPDNIQMDVVLFEEIHLIDCGIEGCQGGGATLVEALYDIWERPISLRDGFTPVPFEYAEAVRIALLDNFIRPSRKEHDVVEDSQSRDMDTILQRLEALDLASYDTRPLAMRGIPQLLQDIGSKRAMGRKNIKLEEYRKRATDLCVKWKPFLLRDAQRSRFRWTYVAGNHLKLKYVIRKPSEAEDLEDIFGVHGQ
ncbi:hypothetical protein DFP72DRAFT_443945 [Ephemerocybe angulata]|uniref:F-box domain-containing protein n=1 Tax=Ephemerocybe angulata TaxID=980116 RepID=A0A8H6HV23_9AGAR|nr:hypothetical protein DFP72DRAFT_443945 [Tulosesus angulatus]